MSSFSRRSFIATSAAAGAFAVLPKLARAATRPDKLRLGLIGCGGRGIGSVADALIGDDNVELIAVADLFEDRVEAIAKGLPGAVAGKARNLGRELTADAVGALIASRANVPASHRFVGWDAYERLCALPEVDVVLMAPPPVFRPLHFAAAMRHNKHVFMEKPVCVDAPGVRAMLELADVADQKKRCVVAGTQRRHQASYLEGMQRLRDGQIGEIVAAQCAWMQDGYVGANLRHPELAPEEMAFQMRNWFVYIWASGDHIVEQHVHNIDVVLWALDAAPEQCIALGGRGVDLPMPAYGNRYSHFAADFTFPRDVHVSSLCRQEPGAAMRVAERFVGTKGVLSFDGRGAAITGEAPWSFDGAQMNPYVQEHIDLYAAIRSGAHLNETRAVTTSCAAAILGREAAYTGRALKYDWLVQRSLRDLTPATYAFGPKAIDPLPIPGTFALL